MAQLVFYDVDHQYEVDGEKYTSTSEVIRFISRDEYGDINQYTLDNAADRGTAVHKAAEQLDRYGDAEVDDAIVPYLQAYVRFLKEHKAEWSVIEKAMFHTERKYAGTIDRFGMVDGKASVVDIKTNSAIKKTLVKAQLNGYEDMRRSQGLPHAEQLLCLQLMKDGKYRLYPCAIDMTEFDACYTLHMALQRRHERGEIT